MNRFDGRVVLITGAARGQGRTHAIGFAAEGADIAICDLGAADAVGTAPYALSSSDDLDETARLAEAEGARVVVERLDVRDGAALQAFADRTIAELGQIDILIVNAGILSFGALTDITEEQFDDVFDINVKGAWNTIRAVVPHMAERQYGRVVVAGSAGSLIGFPYMGHYCATKHALLGLTRSLALEHGKNNVTVNLVCPAMVATPMVKNSAAYGLMNPDNPTEEAAVEIHKSLNAMDTPWVEPEEITRLVMFLASEDARHMTGSAVPIDMGFTAS
jgi:SDR family mycofactocin-dependent oxidoreductase